MTCLLLEGSKSMCRPAGEPDSFNVTGLPAGCGIDAIRTLNALAARQYRSRKRPSRSWARPASLSRPLSAEACNFVRPASIRVKNRS